MQMRAGFGPSESNIGSETGMTERERRLTNEREEIAARVAKFRAMQDKFQREREEYFTTTLQSACEGKPTSFWS